MAGSGSLSHSQLRDTEAFLNKDLNATEVESSPRQHPPHSEALETSDLPNPLQFPLHDQNPEKCQVTLLVPDEDAQQLPQNSHQSGTTHPAPIILTDDTNNTHPPPPPPSSSFTSPVNTLRRPNKRKRFTNKRKRSTKKVQNLTDILNPIPFIPPKTLAFDKHKEALKRLGLWDFSKIEFDSSIRTDLVVQLIVNYDSKKRCSYVNDYRINVNRADMARSLKLPATKQDRGSSSVEEVDLDSEVFSDEAIAFIENFVSNWMLLHEDSWVMPTEIVNWTRCIKDGHPEKLDSASLIWFMVEKELTQGDKLVNCFYVSHLQHLIKSQRMEFFMSEMDVEEVKDEEDGVPNDGVADNVEENVKAEEKEDDERKEEKKDDERKEEKASIVQEHNIELSLGPDVKEVVHEKATEDEEIMVDAEECKEEEEEVEEQGNWLLDGKNNLDEHFLQRCQSSDLNSFEERKPEEVKNEQIEQVEDEDGDEEAGEGAEDGFDMEANDDSLERNELTDNYLREVETAHIPFGSQGELRGMSSMDLFGSRDNSFMAHGGTSFFSNGGKRVMEPEEDIHQLDGNNKRLKTEELWDQKPTDFGFCLEQMQQWMEKAKMIHESKEQSYTNSQFSQQLAMSQLQERQNMMEIYIKSKDEELEKKQTEVFRLERELYLMEDLLAGYRKALKDTRFKFDEYRKRYALHEEPLYKDAGPGGLVLSTRELERQRLKQEEDKAKFLMQAKNLEEGCVYALEMHHEKVLMMCDKLVSIGDEVEKLKEISTQRKETQKPQDGLESSAQPEENLKPQDEKELSAEPEENQKSLEEQELSAELEENQKSLVGLELSAGMEENQKSLDEQESSAEMEENLKSLDERELSAKPEENQKLGVGHELSVEPQENLKSQDDVLENDAIMESVSPDAEESKEKRDDEDGSADGCS